MLVVEVDPVFTPGLAHRQQLEVTPEQRMEGVGDAYNLLLTVPIGCS